MQELMQNIYIFTHKARGVIIPNGFGISKRF